MTLEMGRYRSNKRVLTGGVVRQRVRGEVDSDLVPCAEEIYQPFLALVRIQLGRRERGTTDTLQIYNLGLPL